MKKVVLSLGSNLGDRANYLLQSRLLLANWAGEEVKVSSIYETASWGFTSYNFLNQVVILNTKLTPLELLTIIQQIEKELGRVKKSVKMDNSTIYFDRPIDIDILLFGNETVRNSQLSIPHPKIEDRAFILQPLAELFEDEIVEPFTHSFTYLLNQISCPTF